MGNQSYNMAGSSGSGTASDAFRTISTDGQTDINADNNTDTLSLSAMGQFEIQHHADTDTLILSGGPGSGQNNEDSFKTVSVDGQDDIVADTTTDSLSVMAGSNITLTTRANTDTLIIAAAGGGGGSGSMTTVKSNNSQVGGADIVTLDFSSSFTATESPDTEIQIELAPAMISGLSDVTSTDSDYLLLWDATDSALKKVDAGELRGGGGSSSVSLFDVMMISEVFR